MILMSDRSRLGKPTETRSSSSQIPHDRSAASPSSHLAHTMLRKSLSLTSIGPSCDVTPRVLSRRMPVEPDTPPRSSRMVRDGDNSQLRRWKTSCACRVKKRMCKGSLVKGGRDSNVAATLMMSLIDRCLTHATLRSTQLRLLSFLYIGRPSSRRCLESSGFCQAHSNCVSAESGATPTWRAASLLGNLMSARPRLVRALPVYNHLHFLLISRLQHTPALTQGLNRDVFHAPCVSSPLC
jgi:hypothetical protein